jgi:hypothetical protein
MYVSCVFLGSSFSGASFSRHLSATRGLALMLAAFFAVSPIAGLADWDPGDPYKMHFPQLPDPLGWDIDFMAGSLNEVADDWLCTSSGPITDIHFWYSAFNDGPSAIETIAVSIYSNDPGLPGSFSRPDQLLWGRTFTAADFVTRFYGTGDQGMAEPKENFWDPNNHELYYQANITDIANPFIQQQGEIYWLGLSVGVPAGGTQLGWKTSLDKYEDDAVYRDTNADWQELLVGGVGPSLDMAFVVVPEPTTISLSALAVGLLLMTGRRMRETTPSGMRGKQDNGARATVSGATLIS